MPSISGPVETLKREALFKNPPKDKTAFPALQAAVAPHIESFNALFDEGGLLEHALNDIGVKTVFDGSSENPPFGNKLSLKLDAVYVGKPDVGSRDRDRHGDHRRVFPAECRERHITYRAKMGVKISMKLNDGPWKAYDRDAGAIPVMVRSSRCHLDKLSPEKLAAAKEETEELGGYFVVNGIEKLIRMLIVPKRNHPMAIIRPSFGNRGHSYTQYGIQIRSVRKDQSSQTNVLHYLNDGNATFRFSWRKNEYLIPVMMILNALVETSDREIFDGLVPVSERENTFLTDRVELLLRTYKHYELHSQEETLAFLGDKFRVVLMVGEDMTDIEVGREFLRRIVLVHLDDPKDKFRMLLFMIRKLYALVAGECAPDNPDAVQQQDILLGGFLYGMIIKERCEKLLDDFRSQVRRDIRERKTVDFGSKEYISGVFSKINENVGNALEYFLSTGNLASPTGLDLQQVSGFTVVAEKINFYRFISHFRMVHRGAFFAQLKTTTVRKLLPESWGFLCPVHTPDGSPCGLLNHLAHKCKIITYPIDTTGLRKSLQSLGMVSPSVTPLPASAEICVQLDGQIVGWCSKKQARMISDTLRFWKVEGTHGIPIDLEIGYVPQLSKGQYPGLYLFTQQARMVRPVKYLPLEKEDHVGPFEQPYMSIAVTPQEIESGESTHVELTPTNILSIVANMTPFSDFNQSPRNMYQCQMGKQAMGTPGTALKYRDDNKMYLLQTGQTPIVRSPLYNEYGLDNFPNGMNAVVAVISYTGYDMDDAMIINKSAWERGFAHGSIYKSEVLGWKNERGKESTLRYKFGFDKDFDRPRIEQVLNHYHEKEISVDVPRKPVKPELENGLDEETFERNNAAMAKYEAEMETYKFALSVYKDQIAEIKKELRYELQRINKSISADWFEFIDSDGYAAVGTELKYGCPMAVYKEINGNDYKVFKYKSTEKAYVEDVRLLPCADPALRQEVSIKMRVPRSPQIGDKFSSRHGQKGVCSQKWPTIDMPFSESGMQPDIIINPHAFPSRMTIGMFVESLAGKAGALHGVCQDSTPFQFDEEHTAADYFGHQLKKAGYNYHGNEPMYSGITGEELYADIYIGVVYYQRLRHMVNDKFQVRTTGKIDRLTHQPIKGRKKGGGIRVGEMERDSLLAHGAAFLLQDRLLNCSDYTQEWICRKCGSFSSTTPAARKVGYENMVRCRRCATEAQGFEDEGMVWTDGEGRRWVGGDDTTIVAIPYVLKYLDVELEAMGIGMKFNVKN